MEQKELKMERDILAKVITDAVVFSGVARPMGRDFTMDELITHCKAMGKEVRIQQQIVSGFVKERDNRKAGREQELQKRSQALQRNQRWNKQGMEI